MQRGQHEANYFRMLQQQVGRVDCLVDQLFRMDVEHCLDDDSYFPFDEFIETVTMVCDMVLLFSIHSAHQYDEGQDELVGHIED